MAVTISSEVSPLIDKGFDFLGKAREDFKTSPKHAVVSFWTLLKIPLQMSTGRLLP